MTKIHRPGQFPLRASFLALLTLLPVCAGAAPFEKTYTESMIVPDSITMTEAKLELLDKIRLDAANDAGARLKNVTTLIQNGTVESNPVSVFTQTMVSLIHVGQPSYTFNKNPDGQIELIATARVSVDDDELQKADEKERLITQQQQRIKQLKSDNSAMRDQLLAKPLPAGDLVLPTAPDQKPQPYMPSVREIVESVREDAARSATLTRDERNNNTLTPEQRVRFDQMCERFSAVDKRILGAGANTTYLRAKNIEKNIIEDRVHYVAHVAWDWTAEMQVIRKLMGNVGTIEGNAYVVQGSDVNDKALLVAVRKCEAADRFVVRLDGEDDDVFRHVFGTFGSTSADGKTYRMVFKGDYDVNASQFVSHNGNGLDKPLSFAKVVSMDLFGDSNVLFGTDNPDDPNNFGNEELKSQRDNARILGEVQAQQAQANQQKSTPKHSGFVSFFGRMFAAGITGNTMDPAKCAEYGGVLAEMERPGSSGVYFSCQKAAAEGYGGVIRIVPPLPKPAPQTN